MAEASDPLLLSKSAQKLIAKSDGIPGTVQITNSKVRWKANDASAAKSVAIDISSITKQQQAPGKPFLRILSSSEPLGLAFASEADKDEVLEFLKQLKPSTATAAASGRTSSQKSAAAAAGLPSDAQKRQLFTADKDLEALYGQLVTSGILTEADFWKTRQHSVNKLTGQGKEAASRQRSGLSSVMHEVEQFHDGHTERVNIHLTPKDIQNIFVERPEVHKAYLAHVPHALSETDFWQKYFKLEYKKTAKRRRLAAAGRIDVADEELDAGDDLFAPFRRQVAQQEATAAAAKIRSIDPTVNLVADFGERWSTGEFGSGQSTATGAAGVSSAPTTGKTAPGFLESLSHDLNRHAAQVLGGSLTELPEDGAIAGDTATIAAKVAAAVQHQAKRSEQQNLQGGGSSKSGKSGGGGGEEISKEVLAEWQARAASALEDLSLESTVEVVPLDIQDPRAYFGSSAASNTTTTTAATMKKKESHKHLENSAEAATVAGFNFLDAINASALPNPPCSPSTATAALLEAGRDQDEGVLRQFGPVAAAAMGKHPKDALGSVMVEFFRMEALKTNELLRHLWGCMPMTSDPRRQKANRIATHLEQQRKSLTAHMVSGSGTAQQVHVAQMVKPLVEGIDAALDRHHEEVHVVGR